MQLAESNYKTRTAKNKWNEPSREEAELIALQATTARSIKMRFQVQKRKRKQKSRDKGCPVTTFRENDVLYDSVRSPRYHNNPANESFRAILKSPLEQYNESSSQKTFAERIMEEWKSLDPPGRFLKQDADTKEWFEIDPKVMTRKIRKSFNDLNRVN